MILVIVLLLMLDTNMVLVIVWHSILWPLPFDTAGFCISGYLCVCDGICVYETNASE